MNVTPTAPGTFAQVIRTEQLKSRFTREPDFEAENRALVELAQTLASNPSQILNRLVNLVLELCQAGSSGISILDSETGGNPEQFRWHEALEAYGKERAREAEALAEANKSKDEFIATIAHELRNPMGPIRNTSALLLRGSSDPALVKRAAEIIERQSSVVVRLINDLLDISRMRRGSLELNRSRVNLADVLRAARVPRLSLPSPIVESAFPHMRLTLFSRCLRKPDRRAVRVRTVGWG